MAWPQQIGGGAVIAGHVEPPAQLLQPHGSVLFQRIGGEFGQQLLSSRRIPAKQLKSGDRDLQVLRFFSLYRIKRAVIGSAGLTGLAISGADEGAARADFSSCTA